MTLRRVSTPLIEAVAIKFEGVIAIPAPSLCKYLGSLVTGFIRNEKRDFDFKAIVLDCYKSHRAFHDYLSDVLERLGVEASKILEITARAERALQTQEAWELFDDVRLALEWMQTRRIPVIIVTNTNLDVGSVLDRNGIRCDVMSVPGSPALSDAIWSVTRSLSLAPNELVYVASDYDSDFGDARSLGCRTVVMDRDGRFDETIPNINHLIEVELHI